MSAMVYNLKKYLRFINKIRTSACAATEIYSNINKMRSVFNIFVSTRVTAPGSC